MDFGNEPTFITYNSEISAHEKDMEFDGGYMKIGLKLDALMTSVCPTPYNIMFGSDKCGYTKMTHLIFNFKGRNINGSLHITSLTVCRTQRPPAWR